VDEIFNKATVKESTSKVTYMISDKDISVVVQGPIHTQDNLTKRVLESVRTHLPNAELILSTWKGSDVDGLDCDVLLLNEDPGPLLKQPVNSRNLNRQIISTRNGILVSKCDFVLKLRTDCLLSGVGFVPFFEKFPNRNPKYSIFSNRIITITYFSRNPRYSHCLFHPSDITQFGKKEDMLLNWDISPLNPEDEHTFMPETYIFIECLKKVGNLPHLYNQKFSFRRFKYSENYLINNFIILEPKVYGIILSDSLKQHRNIGLYSQKDWERLYEYYSVNQKETPDFYSFFQAINTRVLFRLTAFSERFRLSKSSPKTTRNAHSQSSRVLEKS
jgi:hypothetical protein